LRRELGKAESSRLIYHTFDLLYRDGMDWRPEPLIERKHALKQLLIGAPPTLVYVDHFEAERQQVLEHACAMGLEGIVSKRRDSPYRSGRQESWIKLKCIKSETFPIVAFVEKLGARPRRIVSLYLKRREGDRLVYAGKARTGYTESVAREVRERVDPLILKKTPLSVPVKKPKATWMRPIVQAEIEHGGFTDDGLLRAAVFKELREDLGLPPRPASPAALRSSTRHKSYGGAPPRTSLQLLPDASQPSRARPRSR
jgi:bifunctional non-homologous end joining protein LigD